MGCYDSVYAKCPGCGTAVEFQSKAGECTLGTYGLSAVPLRVAEDLKDTCATCSVCDSPVTLTSPSLTKTVAMEVV